jgi:uncharacterized repeat protein (TIGR04076 family)
VAELPDAFALYDLDLVVERIEGNCTCAMRAGDTVRLRSGKVSLPDGRDFCLYALQAAIPLLPAKQRQGHPADWMETDTRVTCPDPACRLIMRIDRVGRRTLRHDDVSAVKLTDRSGGERRRSSPRPPHREAVGADRSRLSPARRGGRPRSSRRGGRGA